MLTITTTDCERSPICRFCYAGDTKIYSGLHWQARFQV